MFMFQGQPTFTPRLIAIDLKGMVIQYCIFDHIVFKR